MISEAWVWPAFLAVKCVFKMCMLLLKGATLPDVQRKIGLCALGTSNIQSSSQPKPKLSFTPQGFMHRLWGRSPTGILPGVPHTVGGVNSVEPPVSVLLSEMSVGGIWPT